MRDCRSTALGLLLIAAPAGAAGITEYAAEYEVFYDGKRLASAEFALEQSGDSGSYVFSTATKARAMLRVLRPGEAAERSEFRLTDERIEPMRFAFDDGTRKGEDNFSLQFDRSADSVVLTTATATQSFPLESGLLDRGSLQVALMHDLLRCVEPDVYSIVDDDGVQTYRYERLDARDVGTGIGILPTVRFSQTSEGSSRTTILWFAPELSYLPVRIEQMRNGEIRTIFALEKISGIERHAPPAC